MKQAVRAIVVNENKLLVMRRNKFGTKYSTLIGGAVELGESLEAALRRELMEESGLTVGEVKLVFVEDAGEPYGEQFVYWCQYTGGEPVLSPATTEAKINQLGDNTYAPDWMPITDLDRSDFVSSSLKQAILQALELGFPNEPVLLEWKR